MGGPAIQGTLRVREWNRFSTTLKAVTFVHGPQSLYERYVGIYGTVVSSGIPHMTAKTSTDDGGSLYVLVKRVLWRHRAVSCPAPGV